MISLKDCLSDLEDSVEDICLSDEHKDTIIQGYLHLTERLFYKIISEGAVIYDVRAEDYSDEKDKEAGFYTLGIKFKCSRYEKNSMSDYDVEYYPVTKPHVILTKREGVTVTSIFVTDLGTKKILPETTNIESSETQSLFAVTDIYEKICAALNEKIESLSGKDLGTICQILDLRLTVVKYQ